MNDNCLFSDVADQGRAVVEAFGWRLGCQFWSFHRYSFMESVDKVAAIGLRYAEPYPGQRLSPDLPETVRFSHAMNAEHRVLAQQKLSDADVKALCYGVANMTSEEEAREVFDFAAEMGVETILSEPEYNLLDFIEGMTDEYGINLALHNHPAPAPAHPKPSRYWNCETTVKALENRGARMGACADTGHWMRSGIDPLEAIRSLDGRLLSFHLKDLLEFGVRDAHDVVWGTGITDIPALLSEVNRQGARPVFSIEYDHNLENNAADMAQCADYFYRAAAAIE